MLNAYSVYESLKNERFRDSLVTEDGAVTFPFGDGEVRVAVLIFWTIHVQKENKDWTQSPPVEGDVVEKGERDGFPFVICAQRSAPKAPRPFEPEIRDQGHISEMSWPEGLNGALESRFVPQTRPVTAVRKVTGSGACGANYDWRIVETPPPSLERGEARFFEPSESMQKGRERVFNPR